MRNNISKRKKSGGGALALNRFHLILPPVDPEGFLLCKYYTGRLARVHGEPKAALLHGKHEESDWNTELSLDISTDCSRPLLTGHILHRCTRLISKFSTWHVSHASVGLPSNSAVDRYISVTYNCLKEPLSVEMQGHTHFYMHGPVLPLPSYTSLATTTPTEMLRL